MAQRPKTVVVTGIGVSAPIPVNRYSQNSNIGVGVKLSATATYTVQHTFDDVQAAGFTPAGAKWYDHSTLAAQTTDKDGNYFAPVRAIRLNVAASTGSVTMTLVHGGGGAQ